MTKPITSPMRTSVAITHADLARLKTVQRAVSAKEDSAVPLWELVHYAVELLAEAKL
jgi:hypothetical protein